MQPSNYFKSQMMNALFPPNLDMDLNRVFIHKPGSVRAVTRVPKRKTECLN
jgi:hypothetical protein